MVHLPRMHQTFMNRHQMDVPLSSGCTTAGKGRGRGGERVTH